MNHIVKCIFVLFVLYEGALARRKHAKHNTKSANGTSGNDDKIVGGYSTTIQQVPYQVYLLLEKGPNDYYQCGGSILSPNYVLTASHCLVDMKKIYVRVGSTNSDSGGTQYQSTTFKMHPQYNSKTYDYDVAYIKMPQPMKLDGKTSKAVKLPEANNNLNTGSDLLVSGWGTTSENGATSRTLMAVKVPTVSKADCQKSLSSTITDRMLCAGLKQGGKDSCQGDSGGPAVSNSLQHGIVSFGYGCARPNSPGVYTKVADSQVRVWIKNNTGI